jgi:hypothetical protein
MFTDEYTTPARVETLVDLLRNDESRRWTRDQVAELLQPETLPDLAGKRPQSAKVLLAAGELGLIETSSSGHIKILFKAGTRPTATILREALDEYVLGTRGVEPYFAPFYSYLLAIDGDADSNRSRLDWVNGFRAVYASAAGADPFNANKLTGLHRWYAYAGLGWYDPREVFIANPYERLLRRLPALFQGDRLLPADEFMGRLARCCPELDGGEIFRDVNRNFEPDRRSCSLGLSHALIDLHLDGVLRLHCPSDSQGWFLNKAKPPRDGQYIQSERVDRIEWLQAKGSA